MKPITNLLLLVALICYTFLAFYNIPLAPETVTGFRYTAGNITADFSMLKTIFVLVPYVAGFAAITFNCLRSRWWGLASLLCIAVMITFFVRSGNYHEVGLMHAPDVVTTVGLGEGFPIEGVGIGYTLSYIFVCLAFVSNVVSLMPFKFNDRLERIIDNKVELSFVESKKQLSHLGTKVKEEINEIEQKTWRHPKQ